MVMIPGEDVYCFLAGDPRVNEQTVLAVVHLLMVREHNRSNITRVTCPAVMCPAVTCHTCCVQDRDRAWGPEPPLGRRDDLPGDAAHRGRHGAGE